jgi:hypothetical protein
MLLRLTRQLQLSSGSTMELELDQLPGQGRLPALRAWPWTQCGCPAKPGTGHATVVEDLYGLGDLGGATGEGNGRNIIIIAVVIFGGGGGRGTGGGATPGPAVGAVVVESIYLNS